MSKLSDCCDAPPVGGMEEYDICGKCKEHCEFWDDEGGCLDPENCGMTVKDFDCGDFEGYCENCSEDLEHALQCKMDEFYLNK